MKFDKAVSLKEKILRAKPYLKSSDLTVMKSMKDIREWELEIMLPDIKKMVLIKDEYEYDLYKNSF